MALNRRLLRTASKLLPDPLRTRMSDLYFKHNHWANPKLKQFGTIQDLYYWVSDGDLDTLLILQNYFSVFYPDVDTKTDGSITIYDQDGHMLAQNYFSLPHCGAVKYLMSDILSGSRSDTGLFYGTLQVKINIPNTILDQLRSDNTSFYFWDRFYLGYTNKRGQTCFVHGVDKTDIYQVGKNKISDWYPKSQNLKWAPEIPVDIEDYKTFTIIMINRTRENSNVRIKVSDDNDISKCWNLSIPPRGVRRLSLSKCDTEGLIPNNIRLSVEGMPTQFGRPVVFKEFANGGISAMHC